MYFGDSFLLPLSPSWRSRCAYRLGELVQVSYDPSAPEESVLRRGIQPELLLILAVGVALIVLGVLVLVAA